MTARATETRAVTKHLENHMKLLTHGDLTAAERHNNNTIITKNSPI